MLSKLDRQRGMHSVRIDFTAKTLELEAPEIDFISIQDFLAWSGMISSTATKHFYEHVLSKQQFRLVGTAPTIRKNNKFTWQRQEARHLRLLLVLLYFVVCNAQQPSAPQVVTQAPVQVSSSAPSLAAQPSLRPSNSPSVSFSPSVSPFPSPAPSQSRMPSSMPSAGPTLFPTLTAFSIRRANYQQEFIMPENNTFFTTAELNNMTLLFNNYTELFAPEEALQSTTNCTAVVRDQQKFSIEGTNRARLILLYNCLYTSRRISVLDFPDLYVAFVNGNLDSFTRDVRAIVPRLFNTNAVVSFAISTEAPTFSPSPTTFPTESPTLSDQPSAVPSEEPTEMPVIEMPPTFSPTEVIPTIQPAPPPTSPPTDRKPVALISGVVVGVGLLGLAALVGLYCYLKMKQRQERAMIVDKEQVVADQSRENGGREAHNEAEAISPSESLLSQKSLLSQGESVLDEDSGDEIDGTKSLQDEFDQFRDQTLEQFRSNVEGNLSGFEGIMSAAVTKALMGDDDADINHTMLLWGCQPDPTSAEIEASALCEVNDWLKRNEFSSAEKKRLFMKDIINRMLTTTRFGYLRADDASRTVHESAALLGLPLANELPMTTVLFTGMRKTIEASDMVKVLREFGDIDVAAVASGQRGFGLVRYRNSKSVEKAMRRYRDGEIVIQDVAVQMKVLQPNGAVDS